MLKKAIKLKEERTAIWVCPACGKWGEDRDKLYDVSCYVNAIRCYKDKVRFGKNGRADWVRKGGMVVVSQT